MVLDEQLENEKVEENTEEQAVKLTEEDVKKVKDAIKQAHLDASKLDPNSQKIFEQMLQEAKLPIRLDDKDFKMGEQELDVRHLNRANWRQMEFRQLILQNIYLKQLLMSTTDVLRMLMVIADKLGVEDIVKATDDVIDKIDEAERIKKEKLENKIDKPN